MMKRAIPLLFVVAVLLTFAQPAMASHCRGCKLYPEPTEDPPRCVRYSNYGWVECYPNYETGDCDTYTFCGSHAMVAPLASEFEVASVERLDEPQTGASDALVAAVHAAQPAVR